MPRGFGLFPFGKGGYGLGTVDSSPDLVKSKHTIRQITNDGDLSSTKYASSVRQRVQLILGSKVKSSIVAPEIGIDKPEFIGSDYVERVKSSVRQALQGMVYLRLIEVLGIDVQAEGNRSLIEVTYIDKSTTSEEVKDIIEA